MTEKDSYFMFKLVSGEEIISLTTMDDSGIEPCFFLENPLKVELSHKGNHTMVRLVPWITVSEDELFKIDFDKIITMNELEQTHDMVQAYEHYNYTRKSSQPHKVRISEKMGYKGTVENTRASLEKIFTISAGITTTV